MRKFSMRPLRFFLLFVFLPGCPNVFSGCGDADATRADLSATPSLRTYSCEPLDAEFDPPENLGQYVVKITASPRPSEVTNEVLKIYEVSGPLGLTPVPESERKLLFRRTGSSAPLASNLRADGSSTWNYVFEAYLLKCTEAAYIRVTFDYEVRPGGPNFDNLPDPHSDELTLTVRRVEAPGPDPDPDPDPPTGSGIAPDLAVVDGISAMVGADGKKKLLVTGDGGSEIWDLATQRRELTLPTVNGAGGAAAYTPGGQFLYTALLDRDTGAVRYETFDPANGQPTTSPDFNAAQFLWGPTALPLIPVLLNAGIFSAAGALGQYDVVGTFPGPQLDGSDTVQVYIRIDTTGAGQRMHRAIIVDRKGQDILMVSWNDGESNSFVSRRASAPEENPANFFADTLTIPGNIDRLLAAGDCLLAWESGSGTAKAFGRGTGGDLTVPKSDVSIPADTIDAQPAPDQSDRGYFLRPGSIREISGLGTGAETTRDVALPVDRTPVEFLVCDLGGVRKAIVLFEDGIEVLDLD